MLINKWQKICRQRSIRLSAYKCTPNTHKTWDSGNAAPRKMLSFPGLSVMRKTLYALGCLVTRENDNRYT